MESTSNAVSLTHGSLTFEVTYDKTPINNVNYKTSAPSQPFVTGTLPQKADKLLVIDSVYSGTGRENRNFYGNVIKPILTYLGADHELVTTSSVDTIKNLASTLAGDRQHTIMLLSGDTSIFEIANNARNDVDILLFPIPLGSGNSISNAIGLQDEFSALDAFITFYLGENLENKLLPIYQATFPHGSVIPFQNNKPVEKLRFLVVATWGVHAKLVYLSESPEMKHFGVERFKIAAGQVLASDVAFFGTVSSNPSFKVHNYINIVAVPNLEKTYRISPDSDIFKNELHLLDIGGETRELSMTNEELGALMMKPYQQDGSHIDPSDKRIVYEKVNNEVIITLDDDDEEKAVFCIDGISIAVKKPKGKSVKVNLLKEGAAVGIRVPFTR